ncbi:hypothetical protein [Streptomyces cadmiisoli]|uniref:hypothetical protein n=1 Tax=Streptomyces cadmiisoli TaxID=2184053 RepID=UPI001FECC81B|nr:hypothetical protein [Streptomyces cadmiisoli]
MPAAAPASRRESGIGALRARLERAQAEGDPSSSADADALARYLTAVGQGISVQAADGASRGDLYRVADQALASWPAD